MELNLENRVSMYYKIREFFSNHEGTLADNAPALVDQVASFNTQLTALESLIMIGETDNTGYALQKLVSRTAMRDKALAVGGGVYAHFTITNNNKQANKVYTTKSTLDKKRDTEVLFWCERLRDIASTAPVTAAIVPLGVSGAMLDAYTASIVAYRDVLEEPADKRGETKAAHAESINQSIVVDGTLKILDAIMLAINASHPLLFNQYKADRLIDDNAGGIGSPDITEIIEANGLESIFSVPYLASRSFKIINNGGSDLEWGLSNSENATTSPLHSLAAGASSIKLSSTLASEGDFLLVKNSTPVDCEVQLFVTE